MEIPKQEKSPSLRWAILNLSGRGDTAASTCMSNEFASAVKDRDPNSAHPVSVSVLQEELETVESVLDSVQVDAVYIQVYPTTKSATPNNNASNCGSSFEWAKKALQKGKHVLMDKAATLRNAEDATELVELAEAKNLHVAESFGFLYYKVRNNQGEEEEFSHSLRGLISQSENEHGPVVSVRCISSTERSSAPCNGAWATLGHNCLAFLAMLWPDILYEDNKSIGECDEEGATEKNAVQKQDPLAISIDVEKSSSTFSAEYGVDSHTNVCLTRKRQGRDGESSGVGTTTFSIETSIGFTTTNAATASETGPRGSVSISFQDGSRIDISDIFDSHLRTLTARKTVTSVLAGTWEVLDASTELHAQLEAFEAAVLSCGPLGAQRENTRSSRFQQQQQLVARARLFDRIAHLHCVMPFRLCKQQCNNPFRHVIVHMASSQLSIGCLMPDDQCDRVLTLSTTTPFSTSSIAFVEPTEHTMAYSLPAYCMGKVPYKHIHAAAQLDQRVCIWGLFDGYVIPYAFERGYRARIVDIPKKASKAGRLLNVERPRLYFLTKLEDENTTLDNPQGFYVLAAFSGSDFIYHYARMVHQVLEMMRRGSAATLLEIRRFPELEHNADHPKKDNYATWTGLKAVPIRDRDVVILGHVNDYHASIKLRSKKIQDGAYKDFQSFAPPPLYESEHEEALTKRSSRSSGSSSGRAPTAAGGGVSSKSQESEESSPPSSSSSPLGNCDGAFAFPGEVSIDTVLSIQAACLPSPAQFRPVGVSNANMNNKQKEENNLHFWRDLARSEAKTWWCNWGWSTLPMVEELSLSSTTSNDRNTTTGGEECKKRDISISNKVEVPNHQRIFFLGGRYSYWGNLAQPLAAFVYSRTSSCIYAAKCGTLKSGVDIDTVVVPSDFLLVKEPTNSPHVEVEVADQALSLSFANPELTRLWISYATTGTTASSKKSSKKKGQNQQELEQSPAAESNALLSSPSSQPSQLRPISECGYHVSVPTLVGETYGMRFAISDVVDEHIQVRLLAGQVFQAIIDNNNDNDNSGKEEGGGGSAGAVKVDAEMLERLRGEISAQPYHEQRMTLQRMAIQHNVTDSVLIDPTCRRGERACKVCYQQSSIDNETSWFHVEASKMMKEQEKNKKNGQGDRRPAFFQAIHRTTDYVRSLPRWIWPPRQGTVDVPS